MRCTRMLLAAAGMALAAVALVPAAPAQVPESCPRPGFVVAPGAGSAADRNGNGAVCVDPESGELSDDVDPPERDYDRNKNGVVCYDQARGVVTDDKTHAFEEEGQVVCPGEFQPAPVVLVTGL